MFDFSSGPRPIYLLITIKTIVRKLGISMAWARFHILGHGATTRRYLPYTVGTETQIFKFT